jgi:hypothetical protein
VVQFTLQRQDGAAVTGAKLRLEAHMPHPGMAPMTGAILERGNGTYETRLRLTMTGDWIFVVTGQLTDGSRITEETKVRAVASP